MRTIYALALGRVRVRLLLLALGFGLFELVVGLSYASVDQNAVRSLVDALPPALRALAGSADIATPTGYAGSGYLHPVALAVQAAAAISMAATPAREAEDGTVSVRRRAGEDLGAMAVDDFLARARDLVASRGREV